MPKCGSSLIALFYKNLKKKAKATCKVVRMFLVFFPSCFKDHWSSECWRPQGPLMLILDSDIPHSSINGHSLVTQH